MAAQLKQDGNKLLKEGKTEDALEKYSNAISLSPDEKLYSNRSLCHLKLKNYENALEDAKKAVELNPMWYKSWFRMAEAYKLLLNWKCAIIAYYKASISKDIQNDNKLKKFAQKQLLNAQTSYLTYFDNENNKLLNDEQVINFIKKSLNKYMNEYYQNLEDQKRQDILKRIELFQKSINSNKIMIDDKLKCKEFFGYENPNKFYEPKKCYGNRYCNLKMMNKSITFDNTTDIDEKYVINRFKEWLKSGLCHICQSFIFERHEQMEYLNTFKCDLRDDFKWD